MYGKEGHHIVFRGQGGLDFPDNLIYLTPEEHKGNEGPHENRQRDLQLKRELQARLEEKLPDDYYSADELIKILKLKRGQAEMICRKFAYHPEGYAREEIIRRLMGGKIY